MTELAYLHGKPQQQAKLKSQYCDFQVKEILGYDMTGEGEFVALYVRKTNCNTLFVGEQLAKFVGVSARDWSYAGLKDRHAVTEQWFCFHLPGKQTPDFTQFSLDGVDILHITRHHRKIRIGSLQGNAFSILLRDISESEALLERLQKVATQGFPNYFTEQRFGRDGHNLNQALRWANGEIIVKDRKKRGFYLSAARSEIFNQVVSARIAKHISATVLCGDVVQLKGSNSHFNVQVDELDATQFRLQACDVVLTAPMLGEQGLLSEHDAFEFEQQIISPYSALHCLLQQAKVQSARRAIVAFARHFNYQFTDEGLHLTFELDSGSYATALLREIANITNVALKDEM